MAARAEVAAVSLALALASCGIAVAGYLAVENLQSESGVCAITSGCATVQQSRYGELADIPVSVPGLALYALLAACATAWLTNPGGLRPFATIVAFAGALFGFAFSVYLTYVEGFVLDAWCIYCITSASLLTTIAAIWAAVAVYAARPRDDPAAPIPTSPDEEGS